MKHLFKARRWIGAAALLVVGSVVALAVVKRTAVSVEPRSAAVGIAGDACGELGARQVERWCPPAGGGDLNWEKVFYRAGR